MAQGFVPEYAHVVAPVVEPGQPLQRAVVSAAVAGQESRHATLAGVPAQGCDSSSKQ